MVKIVWKVGSRFMADVEYSPRLCSSSSAILPSLPLNIYLSTKLLYGKHSPSTKATR